MTDFLDYIAIDFETANKKLNSACSVSLVRFIGGKETDSVYSLIQPPRLYFIPEWFEIIHHISYEDVRNKPYFPEVWDTIVMPFIRKTPEVPLAAHNGRNFGMEVIKKCSDYFDMKYPPLEYFDTLEVARKVWPDFKSHTLVSLGEHFGIRYPADDVLENPRILGRIIKHAADEVKADSVKELLQKTGLQAGSFSALHNMQRIRVSSL